MAYSLMIELDRIGTSSISRSNSNLFFLIVAIFDNSASTWLLQTTFPPTSGFDPHLKQQNIHSDKTYFASFIPMRQLHRSIQGHYELWLQRRRLYRHSPTCTNNPAAVC